MVLKITFTNDEIAAFFTSNGYKVEEREFTHYVRTYHNKTEPVVVFHPVVVGSNGKFVKAISLFEKVAEYRIKKLITPTNLETRRGIAISFKRLLKRN